MASVLEKAGIDPEEVANHAKEDWPRCAVSGVVLLIEWWFVYSYARHHYKYGSIGGAYFFLKLFVFLAIFEILRWSDFLVHHYFLKGQAHRSGHRAGAGHRRSPLRQR